MSAQTPKPLDDRDGLIPPFVALHPPEVCDACNLPHVVCEQRTVSKKASRRFWLLCPQCGRGRKVLAQLVVEGVEAPSPSGCPFDAEAHRCTHKYSWSCKPPRLRRRGAKKRGGGGKPRGRGR